MKKKEDDVSSEIKKMKIYIAILAVIVVVMGVYVAAMSFGGLGKLGATGKASYLVTSPPTVIYVSDARNVGIGTNNPTDKLTVSGTTKSSNVFADHYLKIGTHVPGSNSCASDQRGNIIFTGAHFWGCTDSGQYQQLDSQ